MATRVVTQLISDLTGKEIEDGDGETIEFSYRGAAYVIDLTAQEATKFDSVVAKYLEHARRVRSEPGRTAAGSSSDAKAIRAWARETGLKMPDRGRIPSDIREKYQAAH